MPIEIRLPLFGATVPFKKISMLLDDAGHTACIKGDRTLQLRVMSKMRDFSGAGMRLWQPVNCGISQYDIDLTLMPII